MVGLAKKMAKGTVWLMVATIVFMGSGYIIHFGLARMVTPEEYGIYGVILSLLAVTQIFLQNGVPQSVSKFVAEGRDIKSIRREGIKAQILFLMVIFPVYFLSAPFISNLLGDSRLTIYIQLSSLLIPIRAIYVIALSMIEGARQFGKDAKVRVFYSIIRVVAVYLLLFLGLGIFGVIYGFMFASMCVLIIGWYLARNLEYRGDKSINWREIASFSLPVVIFALSYTAIMNIDLLFVKSLITDGEQAGYYTSAWTLAKTPFFIFSALSLTLVPSISKSMKEVNIKQIQSYISHSLRYFCMIVIPLIFLVIATAPELISLLFTPEYNVAGNSLSILILGISFLTVFITLSMVIVGSGKPTVPMAVGAGLVPIDALLNILLIPYLQLEGAALATTITAFIGMIIIVFYILIRFNTLLKVISFLRILIASLVIFFIALLLNVSGILIIVLYVCLFVLYAGLLYLIRELNKEDIKIVKELLKLK